MADAGTVLQDRYRIFADVRRRAETALSQIKRSD